MPYSNSVCLRLRAYHPQKPSAWQSTGCGLSLLAHVHTRATLRSRGCQCGRSNTCCCCCSSLLWNCSHRSSPFSSSPPSSSSSSPAWPSPFCLGFSPSPSSSARSAQAPAFSNRTSCRHQSAHHPSPCKPSFPIQTQNYTMLCDLPSCCNVKAFSDTRSAHTSTQCQSEVTKPCMGTSRTAVCRSDNQSQDRPVCRLLEWHWHALDTGSIRPSELAELRLETYLSVCKAFDNLRLPLLHSRRHEVHRIAWVIACTCSCFTS